MSRTEGRSSTPRAVIHKRILDVAESNPSASMEEIADEIDGASMELVERVLEQYGDPAGEEQGGHDHTEEQNSQDDAGKSDDHTMDDQDDRDDQDERGALESTRDASEPDVQTDENGRSNEDPPELSNKQVKTLRLIEEHPGASQSDLANEFDVTRATISRWLNDIPGFEWTRRRELASEILNSGEIREMTDQDGLGRTEGLDTLRQRLDALERRINQVETDPETEFGEIEPELAHKVVHASMQYDRITEAEELQLLKQLMD